jgi:hypothetical protein
MFHILSEDTLLSLIIMDINEALKITVILMDLIIAFCATILPW